MQLSKIQIPASIIWSINFLMIFDEIVQNEARHGDLSLVGLCTCSGEQMEKTSKDLCFLQHSSAAACSWNTLGSSAQHSGSIWLQLGSKFIIVKLPFPVWMSFLRNISLRSRLLKGWSASGLVSQCVSLRTCASCWSYAANGIWAPKWLRALE